MFPSETQDMKDYIKPIIARKPHMVVLHTGTNDLKINQITSNIANEIINLTKNIKISGTEASIILDTSWRSTIRVRKKINKELQENCAAEKFVVILHKNINSKLDLFSQ